MKNSMYLLAKYYLRPRNPQHSARKGYWSEEGAGQMDEQLSFARKVRNSDLQTCNVILNLTEKKIIKCSIGDLSGSDYDRIFDYFKTNYPEHIAEATKHLEHPDTVDQGSLTSEVLKHAPSNEQPNVVPVLEHTQIADASKSRRRNANRRTQGK